MIFKIKISTITKMRSFYTKQITLKPHNLIANFPNYKQILARKIWEPLILVFKEF